LIGPIRAMYPKRSNRSPRSGGRASDGRLPTALTIWLSSLIPTLPSERGGIRLGHSDRIAVDSAIQPTVGSTPRIVTLPAPYADCAAITRSALIARTRPRVSSPAIAGTSFAPSGAVPISVASESGATSIVDVGR